MIAVGELHRCPPPEVLAAFVDGKLSKERIIELTSHLASCAECRLVVESVREFQEEEQAELSDPQGGRAWRWIAVAAVVGAVLLYSPARLWLDREVAMHDLKQKAAALPERPIQGRVSGGFEYVQPTRVTRGPGEDQNKVSLEQLSVDGAAGDVLKATRNDTSPAAAHARGIAFLMTSDQKNLAIPQLLTVVNAQPKNAKAWSDLSAAYYATNQFTEARDAANRAVQLDPKLNEAWFNRAVALNSVAAWQEYLQHDSEGEWAKEAHEHLAMFGPLQ